MGSKKYAVHLNLRVLFIISYLPENCNKGRHEGDRGRFCVPFFSEKETQNRPLSPEKMSQREPSPLTHPFIFYFS